MKKVKGRRVTPALTFAKPGAGSRSGEAFPHLLLEYFQVFSKEY
jgi:hypothetical protein